MDTPKNVINQFKDAVDTPNHVIKEYQDILNTPAKVINEVIQDQPNNKETSQTNHRLEDSTKLLQAEENKNNLTMLDDHKNDNLNLTVL